MTPEARQALVDAVQINCHIADASHAADLSLCIYLLQMREYYRWTHRLPWTAPLDRGAVGGWLSEREARWAHLLCGEVTVTPRVVAVAGAGDTVVATLGLAIAAGARLAEAAALAGAAAAPILCCSMAAISMILLM